MCGGKGYTVKAAVSLQEFVSCRVKADEDLVIQDVTSTAVINTSISETFR